MNSHQFFLTTLGSLLVVAGGFRAEGADPVITSIKVEGEHVILVVEQDGSLNDFDLESNPNLNPVNWSTAGNAVITPLGRNQFQFTAPKTSLKKNFYRVIGRFLSSSLDRDGDGLPNELEISQFGTNPDRFDTDQDGFNDSTEIAYGTNPNNPNDFPDQANLPEVEFVVPLSTAAEGDGTHQILLKATPTYTGPVSYRINARSSAKSGVDFNPVSGTTFLSGNGGSINLSLIDDLVISPQQLIIIDLTIGVPGSAYRASGAVTHVVALSDNDAYWSGSLKSDLTEQNIRACILQNAGTKQLNFVSGSQDGLPAPDSNISSQSTGLIPNIDLMGNPKTSWPATGVVFDPSAGIFTANVANMPVNQAILLNNLLQRQLSLSSSPNSNAGDVFQEDFIHGAYQEVITHAEDPSKTYLDRTIEGRFTMVRDAPQAPAINSAFNPLDPPTGGNP